MIERNYKTFKDYLVMEDDASPDARKHFWQTISEKYNLHSDDFYPSTPIKLNDGMTLQWHYKGYILEYSGDDPFYILKSGVVQ